MFVSGPKKLAGLSRKGPRICHRIKLKITLDPCTKTSFASKINVSQFSHNGIKENSKNPQIDSNNGLPCC